MMSNLLQTHLSDADSMYGDDFKSFFNKRRHDLLGLISQAMGKNIDESIGEPEPETHEVDETDMEMDMTQGSMESVV